MILELNVENFSYMPIYDKTILWMQLQTLSYHSIWEASWSDMELFRNNRGSHIGISAD
jgi:hypothetical protein